MQPLQFVSAFEKCVVFLLFFDVIMLEFDCYRCALQCNPASGMCDVPKGQCDNNTCFSCHNGTGLCTVKRDVWCLNTPHDCWTCNGSHPDACVPSALQISCTACQYCALVNTVRISQSKHTNTRI